MQSSVVLADAQECARINDSSKRLACYDKFAKNLSGDLLKHTYVRIKSNFKSSWELITDRDTEGGGEILYLRLYSKQMWVKVGQNTDIDKMKSLRPSMWLRCANGIMSGLVDWGIFLDVHKAKILFRFDNEKIKKEWFQVSRDNKKIVSMSEKRLISRITEMFKQERLTARITPYGEKPILVTFNITGLETAILPLRNACNW